MSLRVTQILGGIVFLAVWLLQTTASEASLISFDSDIGRSAPARQSSAASKPKVRSVADVPVNPDSPLGLEKLLAQNSNAAGAGSSLSLTFGSSVCVLAEVTAVAATSPLISRVCEMSLVLPSPHLDAMLRPPRK